MSIKTVLRNTEASPREFVLRHSVQDAEGQLVGTLDGRVSIGAGESTTQTSAGQLERISYWSPAAPHLYTVRTELLVDGTLRDVATTQTGFRSIAMKDGRFMLNGQPICPMGAALHEISERHFHTIRPDEIRRDLESLRDVGYNTAFLAHYPHSQYAYDLADKMGLLVWAEDGFVNGSYESKISSGIVREMVRQYYNHPSIFCWSAANEPSKANQPFASALLGVLRSEHDSRRLVTYNDAFQFNPDSKSPFVDPQADFVTSSVFSGWYADKGDVWTYHYPYVNQCGGGGLITQQTDYRDRYHKRSIFKPEEYQMYLGEVWSKRAYEDREYFLHLWWGTKDFPAASYRHVINTKGLMTFAGYRKDLYYLFQACLRKYLNTLHICGKHWFLRGTEGNAIKVYSSSREVQLKINGRKLVVESKAKGRRLDSRVNGRDYSLDGHPIKNVFYWEHVLAPGRNEITATDGTNSDSCVIYFAPQGVMPEESGSLVTALKASQGPAWAINRAPEDQWPVYAGFDGQADNTFDVVPAVLRRPSSKITWIVTDRQSDPGKSTDLSFRISSAVRGRADVWLMITKERQVPDWISKAGFSNTGMIGQWRNESTYLVDHQILRKQCQAGERIELDGHEHPTDYAVFVTADESDG